MRFVLSALVLATLAGAARAEAPLSAAEFEAITTGRTLTYAQGGFIYGIEQYKPGRRVVWAFAGDTCREGVWYQEGEAICFVYEDDPGPQCWLFHARPGGMTARVVDQPPGSELTVVAESAEPLACMGPDVGV